MQGSQIDWSVLFAFGSLLVSAWNFYKYVTLTKQCNKLTEIQTLTAQGALESQIREMIMQATNAIGEAAIKLDSNPDNETVKKAYQTAEENYRNVYEDACAKYLDNKVDKERFKKMYMKEIQQLVEDNVHKEYYASLQTPYASTAAVYQEWFKQA